MSALNRFLRSFISASFVLIVGLQSAKAAGGGAPTPFFELEPVVVNLAGRDANRYLQVGMSYEVSDPVVKENLKTYLPIIRSRALLVLSTKTVEDLSSVEGKHLLMDQLIDVARVTIPNAAGDPNNGIEAVHLTSFFIQ